MKNDADAFIMLFLVGFVEKLVLQLQAVQFKMSYRQMLPLTLVIVEGHF